MFRKFFALPLLLLCLFLSGCNYTLLTENQSLKAVNEAVKEYGLKFSKAKTIPDMPEDAVLVFDADSNRKVKTEVYFENSKN